MTRQYHIIFKDNSKMVITPEEYEKIQEAIVDEECDKFIVRSNVIYKSSLSKILTREEYLDQYEGGQYI